MELRRNQVETRALQAVEAALSGRRVEDDWIECKRDWPDDNKVRQLAGHANAARGEPIIWLIGVDEKAHKLTQPSQVDPADWWSKMAKRFDQVVPEMVDITVHLDEGRTITALAFTTDQAPYVITSGSEPGRGEREVPIRVATGTRSAHRHELLRLLTPTVPLPQLIALASEAWTTTGDEQRKPSLVLRLHVFFEHLGGAVMLPAHHMQARLDFDTRHFPWDLEPIRMLLRPTGHIAAPGTLGVGARDDGMMITGSGAQWLAGSTTIHPEWLELLSQVPAVQARCNFAAAGTTRRIELAATLNRVMPASAYGDTRWEFAGPVEDPWADDTSRPE